MAAVPPAALSSPQQPHLAADAGVACVGVEQVHGGVALQGGGEDEAAAGADGGEKLQLEQEKDGLRQQVEQEKEGLRQQLEQEKEGLR